MAKNINYITSDGIRIEDGNGAFKRKKPFTAIPTEVLRSKNLSLSAIGLYAVIMSYLTIPNFILYKATLMSASSGTVYAFNRDWKELKSKGYLKQYRIRDKEKNCFIYQYDLLEKPDTVTPALINIRIDNTENMTEDEFVCARNVAEHIEQAEVPSEIESVEHIDITDNEEELTELIKENIGYDFLTAVEEPSDVDCILSTMKSVISSKRPTYHINGSEIAADKVKHKLLSLNEEHIQAVLQSIRKQSSKKNINNLQAYLIASLYNAPNTVDLEAHLLYLRHREYVERTPAIKLDVSKPKYKKKE